jgi:MOSC domain-containing protein
MPRIAQIYIYPVKSCRGIRVDEAEISPRGFLHDREFLVVDSEGHFLTQRTTPKLALVETALSNGVLHLKAPGLPEIQVSLSGSKSHEPKARTLPVIVWQDSVLADDAGEESAAWLSEFLGMKTRLVCMGAGYSRPISREKVPEPHQSFISAPEVSFADAYPFLVLSEASLTDLNSRMPVSLPLNRFRPNLVVSGCRVPYEEDRWTTFRVNGATFRHGGPCVRCVVTTTDQRTLERGPEPLKTLAQYRRTAEGGVIFGMNFLCENRSGNVRVGDVVETA